MSTGKNYNSLYKSPALIISFLLKRVDFIINYKLKISKA